MCREASVHCDSLVSETRSKTIESRIPRKTLRGKSDLAKMLERNNPGQDREDSKRRV